MPTPRPLPAPGRPVETVEGPYGPIYPDGYTDPAVVNPPPLAPVPEGRRE